MKIETINISEIKEYKNNAKDHPQWQIDQIERSIQEFGNNDPIAIDENNTIIEGHGRYKALMNLGYTEVPVIRLSHLSDEQKKAYILTHNKLTMNTNFNFELLESELSEIISIDMSNYGFDVSIDKMSNLLQEDEELLDEILETKDEVDIKRGDLFQLGKHRLMCGDSTNSEDVKMLMNGELSHMVVTDPPYNVNYEEKDKHINKFRNNKKINEGKYRAIANDSLNNEDFYNFLFKIYINLLENLQEGGAYYVWYANSESINFLKALKDAGSNHRQILIWKKNTIVLGRQDYQWDYEPCIYGWREGASHNWFSDRKQRTTLEYDKPQKSELHPTMKPVELFKYLIENSSRKGEVVLDLFGGSGTTIIACEESERIAKVMEYEPKYCDVIIRRWEALTGEKAIKIN